MVAGSVEVFHKGAAILQLIEGESLCQVQVTNGKSRAIRITPGLERIVLGAEPPASEVAGIEADTARLRHGHVGWDAALARTQLARRDRPDGRELALGVGPADTHVLGRQHAMSSRKMIAGIVMQGADD